MIELNLLPDIKLEYLRAEKSRRLFLSVSVLATGAAVAILVILLAADFVQKHDISSLSSKISTESTTLKSKPNISAVLTVQNQLQSLTELHSTKLATSRIFSQYLDQVTPSNVSISEFDIDLTQKAITITGNSDSLNSVDAYIDTLKSTTYTTGADSTAQNAFSDVVLTSFGYSSTTSDPTQAASYTINLSYDPTILDITQTNVKLNIPTFTITRSQLVQPDDLFQAAPTTSKTSISTTGGS
jgi:Tfp pilus assembly protein PilN